MVWWILLGGFVAGLVLLALAAAPVLRRVRPLARALRRLQLRAEEAQALAARAEELQEHLEALDRQRPVRS